MCPSMAVRRCAHRRRRSLGGHSEFLCAAYSPHSVGAASLMMKPNFTIDRYGFRIRMVSHATWHGMNTALLAWGESSGASASLSTSMTPHLQCTRIRRKEGLRPDKAERLVAASSVSLVYPAGEQRRPAESRLRYLCTHGVRPAAPCSHSSEALRPYRASSDSHIRNAPQDTMSHGIRFRMHRVPVS